MKAQSELAPGEDRVGKSGPAAHGVVEAAHVGADREDLFRFELHKLLDQDDRLVGVVTAGQLLDDLKNLLALPLAELVLDVAEALPAKVDLAEVVQEGDDGNGVGLIVPGNPAGLELLQKTVVDVEGVLEEAGAVKKSDDSSQARRSPAPSRAIDL